MNTEALARIKINNLLNDAGWRFFDDENGYANIRLELNAKIKQSDIDEMGKDFEKTKNGFVDYLLLDENNKPFVVVEAKKENIHPLNAKEQARKYANELRAKYVILTNGNMHYFWNLEKGNPEMITSFPTYNSLITSKALTSKTDTITEMKIDKYFVALSQDPSLTLSSAWKSSNDELLSNYCFEKGLRVLRYYQLNAIKSVQNSIASGNTRFLLEMATGTGKTLTSAGIVKMFIRSDLAHRVLFLVDRLELENQAKKDLLRYLSKDGIRVEVYKENKKDWNSADVVVSTIQSFTRDDKYKKIFTPTDFDLIISDEAHRSLGASNRAVFEYFMGYKLGLTATPKNYLKGVEFDETDPREIEKRMLLDTYQIFGCKSGSPTFSYTLNDGVKDGILINPTIVDARTDITTELLSDKGLTINIEDDDVDVTVRSEGGKKTKIFTEKGFEKNFFSEVTNRVLCATFMENALRDPITSEIGKSIVFCVNVQHARKITELLNEYADQKFPGKYNSDFAIQITSNVADAQQMTINFANNNLMGHTKWLEDYDSSKARVAVTVGMM
ncbi:MAG: DEAD/DEAH box helicase family protein, partial [Bacilli bacterium]|nr:DEAD/DEAH box helicase family protein [Bacilli bacterium]